MDPRGCRGHAAAGTQGLTMMGPVAAFPTWMPAGATQVPGAVSYPGEGVKLTVNKGLSNHFQVNHTVAELPRTDCTYHSGVMYVGTKQLSPTETFPVLVGDMDSSGSLNAQVIHQPGPASGPRWPSRPSSQRL
ncbi:Mitochondrial import receptor subunit TOM40 like protein [Myotis davidii]|uniref:Mitochondrial import receptor subunit TOM40 like protein n=1 Tax=Myotis davidii TaxID=225400 RepID=L5M5Y5_MYODS|nr:Mitochondrial import receptor subunit TOM40 like protein [Myotis davidii]